MRLVVTVADAADLRSTDVLVDADPLTSGGIRDRLMTNAPQAEHGFFTVPKVIE